MTQHTHRHSHFMSTKHIPSHRGLEQLNQLAQAQAALPSTTAFYFLRHGQTARNAARVFQDRDEPLDAAGQQQASDAAQRLAREPIRSIVCSDVLRASQTADTVARQLAVPSTANPGLRERHFGALIGTSSVKLDWACIPADGETLEEFVQRTCKGVAEALAPRTHPAPVLLVAHGGNLLVLAAWLGVALPPGALGNAQPLHFTHAAGQWHITPLLQIQNTAYNLA